MPKSGNIEFVKVSAFLFYSKFRDKWGQNGDNPFLGGLLPIEITFWPLPGSESKGSYFVVTSIDDDGNSISEEFKDKILQLVDDIK